MDESLLSDSIKKRLSRQNEVLNWLKEFSEKLQRRANDATMEIHGLSDQARFVELDLKNTFNSFRSLSYNRFIYHSISDEDDAVYHIKEYSESSAEGDIPAQNYETDILPRYKEALSMGLASCKKYIDTTKKNPFTSSIFRTGSAHGLLPHIIGSEEYIHDNSCGLIEELGPAALDLSCMMEHKGVSSDSVGHNSHDLSAPHLFGMRHGSPEKDGTEHLVSAASDFKAMLEAALLNTYKIYDEEILSVHDAVSDGRSAEQTHKDVDSATLHDGNLTSLQDPDIRARELYSALASASLFDTEESMSWQTSIVDDNVFPESSDSASSRERLDVTNHNIGAQVEADASVSINREERRCEDLSGDKLKDVASSSSIDIGDEIGAIKVLCHSDPRVAGSSEEKSSGRDSVRLQDADGPNFSATPAEKLCSRSDSEDECK